MADDINLASDLIADSFQQEGSVQQNILLQAQAIAQVQMAVQLTRIADSMEKA